MTLELKENTHIDLWMIELIYTSIVVSPACWQSGFVLAYPMLKGRLYCQWAELWFKERAVSQGLGTASSPHLQKCSERVPSRQFFPHPLFLRAMQDEAVWCNNFTGVGWSHGEVSPLHGWNAKVPCHWESLILPGAGSCAHSTGW